MSTVEETAALFLTAWCKPLNCAHWYIFTFHDARPLNCADCYMLVHHDAKPLNCADWHISALHDTMFLPRCYLQLQATPLEMVGFNKEWHKNFWHNADFEHWVDNSQLKNFGQKADISSPWPNINVRLESTHFVQILFEELLHLLGIFHPFSTRATPTVWVIDWTECNISYEERGVWTLIQKIVGKSSTFQNHIFSSTYGNSNWCRSPHYSTFFRCTNSRTYERRNT